MKAINWTFFVVVMMTVSLMGCDQDAQTTDSANLDQPYASLIPSLGNDRDFAKRGATSDIIEINNADKIGALSYRILEIDEFGSVSSESNWTTLTADLQGGKVIVPLSRFRNEGVTSGSFIEVAGYDLSGDKLFLVGSVIN